VLNFGNRKKRNSNRNLKNCVPRVNIFTGSLKLGALPSQPLSYHIRISNRLTAILSIKRVNIFTFFITLNFQLKNNYFLILSYFIFILWAYDSMYTSVLSENCNMGTPFLKKLVQELSSLVSPSIRVYWYMYWFYNIMF